jgi:membrane fusion protein, copper/silver efflux system
LNPDTHTLKARVAVSNPGGTLKLGMYAEALLQLPLGVKTVVPESAVMQTGTRSYVFRDDDSGKLTPVGVRVGLRNEGYFEVLAGVKAGDRVVTSANFLVDSESSIRAAIEGRIGGD